MARKGKASKPPTARMDEPELPSQFSNFERSDLNTSYPFNISDHGDPFRAMEISPFAEADEYLTFETPTRTTNKPRYSSQKSKTISSSSASCTFSFEFPQSAAEVILNKEEQLKEYVTELKDADCVFESGYDLLPQRCWLVFEEQKFLMQGICLCLLC